MRGTVPYLAKPPSFEIRDGNIFLTSDEFTLVMPLRAFRMAMARATDVLRDYDETRVVAFPRKRRRGDDT